MLNRFEVRARFIGGFMLLLLGGWVLHSYLALLLWAVVLAITTWPVYKYLLASKELHGKVTWVSLSLTLLIGAIILVPLAYGLTKVLDEAQSLGKVLVDAQNVGIPAPAWLENVPVAGQWAQDKWVAALGTPEDAKETLHGLGTSGVVTYTKALASQLLHRLFNFFITLVVLFFVYQHGKDLGRNVLLSIQKLFSDKGARYAVHAAAAVRATVNGLVLVGLSVGLFLGLGYAFAGFSHPAILGALTGVFGMVPFAAKLVFVVCALVLMAQGNMVAGVALLVYGFVVVLIADNYVRPKLIGGAVKLPFLWTLLGILGGLENFGLLGLFLGPTLMAVLMSIWRDWIEDLSQPQANGS